MSTLDAVTMTQLMLLDEINKGLKDIGFCLLILGITIPLQLTVISCQIWFRKK
jgi:hypothetical protein